MRIEDGIKLGFANVSIRPKRSGLDSRKQVDLSRSFTFLHSHMTWTGIPVIASNMDTIGTLEMASSLSQLSLMTALHKFYTAKMIKEWIRDEKFHVDFTQVSSGITDADLDRLRTILIEIPSIKFICLDVANGYSQNFVNVVEKVRCEFPKHTLTAGNVVTPEMTEQLLISGADIVKVGIGSGSVCTTRVKTGVGYPQFSAVIECADAAHGLKGHIISDGGCNTSGDMAKAFAGGADFIMLGGMLAGHDECAGKIEEVNGTTVMRFYGMSSKEAMEKTVGEVAHYRATEGKSVRVPYRGPVKHTIQDILGGIRSTCTYVGAPRLKDLSKCTTFVQVNEQENQIFNDYE